MKSLFSCFFISFFFICLASSRSLAAFFILEQQLGEGIFEDSHGLVKKTKIGQKFVDLKSVETHEGQIRLGNVEWGTLMIFKNSRIEIEVRDSLKTLHLIKGQIRYLKGTQSVILKDPVSEVLEFPKDLILEFIPEKPESVFTVLESEGQWLATGRELVTVKAGERSRFRGLVENGLPAFDLLFKGQRVARGDYLALQQLPSEVLGLVQKELMIPLPPPKKVFKPVRGPGQICEAPFAKFNECAWFCENNPKKNKICRVDLPQVQCVRRRCNANGLWKEDLRLPASQKYFCEKAEVSARPCF